MTDRPKRSETRHRGVVISVRLTDAELATIQEKAEAQKLTMSGFLRQTALGEIERETKTTQDLTITIHREDGRWWAKIAEESSYVTGDSTFDGLTERIAEGLHLLGLSRERAVIILAGPTATTATTSSSGPRTLTLWEAAV